MANALKWREREREKGVVMFHHHQLGASSKTRETCRDLGESVNRLFLFFFPGIDDVGDGRRPTLAEGMCH